MVRCALLSLPVIFRSEISVRGAPSLVGLNKLSDTGLICGVPVHSEVSVHGGVSRQFGVSVHVEWEEFCP